MSDNAGITIPPDVWAGNPRPGSGVTLTDQATGADHEQAVVRGGLYAFTCRPAPTASGTATDITFVFGIATVATAANILWVCPPGETVIIQIPDDIAVLHYMSLASGGSGFLRRLW